MRGIRERRADVGGAQYQMRERVFSIGDDFWIETPDGERAFKVNEVAPGEDAARILAAAVCIDRMSHD